MATENSLVEQLSKLEILSPFSVAELNLLAGQVERRRYDLGDTIFKAGDAADGLLVVAAGAVRLFREQGGKTVNVGVHREGSTIAEVAALRPYRHEVSARSSGKTELLYIPRAALAPMIAANPGAESFVSQYAMIGAAGGLISQLFDLRGKIDRKELKELVHSVGAKKFSAGMTVLQQGDRNDQRLYLVRQGQLSVVRSEDGVDYPLGRLDTGDTVGEQVCLQGGEQPATVTANSDCVLLVLPQSTVKALLEVNPALRAEFEQRIEATGREVQRQKKVAERRDRGLRLDLRSQPGLGERVVKRFPLVEQAEESDCGAACLAMICRHYGVQTTLGKLREMANVTTEGATMDSLARVGESLGFTTRGLQCTYEGMLGFELPFIAHWEGYHYIIVYGISRTHVWVADPALGYVKMTAEEFEKGWTGVCLLFTPGDSLAEFSVSRSPWTRFVRMLRPHRAMLGYLLLATVVIETLGIAPPIIVQNVLDRVLVHQSYDLLTVLIIGFALVTIFTQLTSLMRSLLANFMVRGLDFTMMSRFFQHTLSLPVGFFAKRRTGDIFARFQENHTIRAFLTESTVSTILNLLMLFLYFIVLFMYNAKMTLLLLVMIIPLAVLTLAITPRIKQYARRNFEASTDAEAVLMETLSGAETVKAMGLERPMRMRWEKKYARSLNVQYDSARFDALVGMTSQLMHATVTIVMLWVGATLVLSQELTVGQLIAFNMLMGSVMSPIMGLIGLWDELHEAGVAMERLGDVLDMEPEQKPEDLPSRILLPDLRGDIVLENVYFRYGGDETPYVLENLNLTINAGETVAVVGHSGSGKSTLAKMLIGFFAPSEGKITFDGYDLNLLDKEYLRSQIGYVMQNNLLFTGTVAENIALGEENPDQRRVVEAARLADAHAFISKLPLGYNQVVGERGVGLSGGQIQRVCIARALYNDPRLLILDEATSALDTQSESNILGNLQQVLEGRTALVIAHRLSTIMSADKIVVLYEGKVVEAGVHQDLLDRRGMYYELVQKQVAA